MSTRGRRSDSSRVSRRSFLCGAGVALSLPWLPSLPARATDSGKLVAAPDPVEPPRRFACVFFSNGVEPEHWWARGGGGEMELGRALEPLLPFRNDIVFLRGLFNERAAAHKSPHLGRMANLLSGAWVSTEQDEIRVGRTMDQVLADRIGRETRLPSLVLGIEPTELRLEDGLSMIYGSAISWASATKPATKEIYPARAYDLIVGSGKERALDRSILDGVLDDARRLRGTIDGADREKLDEYLESIRHIEERIDRATRDGRLEGSRRAPVEPDMPRPAASLPQDVSEHMRLMLDLVVLAFQMDRTRVATLMLNNDLSQMNFGFLDGVKGSLHLDLTHNGHDPAREAMYLKTNQFHFSQFAHLVDRLRSIDEGGRSILDSSILLGCSNLLDGDKHEADEMPMVLAGRGGGTLETGRVLDYRDRGDENRRACSLYLSIFERMGISLPRFGDATRPLEGI